MSSLSLAVLALAICDMNVLESVTSWASSFDLLRCQLEVPPKGQIAHS